jgi:EAL domain-containing protein (putative c-di-GMP-specific phosphodiesterase class I)
MSTHLERLLVPEALTAVFQPIVDTADGGARVFAYEGLVRGPASSNFEQPDVLFSYVRLKRGEERIDRACVAAILRAAPRLPSETRMSINVHAATLGREREFPDYVVAEACRNGIAANRIMLEIVEHGSAWDEPHFLAGVARARQLGLSIALDDIGAGLSNYKMIIDIHPDFFKIDRYLVMGCSSDGDRRKVLTSIRDLARSFGGRTIAEGVENEEELRCLIDLDIELMQGFLFARPQSARTFQSFGDARVASV